MKRLGSYSAQELSYAGNKAISSTASFPLHNGQIDLQRDSAYQILFLIVSGTIQAVASSVGQLPELALSSLKKITREMIEYDKDKLGVFQGVLGERSDHNIDTLVLMSHPAQLQILAAVKTGLSLYLYFEYEDDMQRYLAEIILNLRCRNIDCNGMLPWHDCHCRFCSSQPGFCNFCMCLVCGKFDDFGGTCGSVECDHCAHCCHTQCALAEDYIKHGTEISRLQFYCPACELPTDMPDFVENIFHENGAKWDCKEMYEQLKYVKMMFNASIDHQGTLLRDMADMLIVKLEREGNVVEIYHQMVQFLNGEPLKALEGTSTNETEGQMLNLHDNESADEEDKGDDGRLRVSPHSVSNEETEAQNAGRSSFVFSIQVEDPNVESASGQSLNGEGPNDQDDCPQELTNEPLVAMQFAKAMQEILSRTLGNKVFVKWAFIVVNVVVEIFQAVLTQEVARGKMHRQLYLILSIVTSSFCLVMSLIEAFRQGRSSGVEWRKRGHFGWFYHPGGQGRLFGSFFLYFGIICSLVQLVINVIAKVTHKDFIQFDYVPLLLAVCHMVAAVISSEEKTTFSAIVECNAHGSKEVEGKILKGSGKYSFECPDCSSQHSLRQRTVNRHSS